MRVITGSLRGRQLKFVKNPKVRPLTDKVKAALYSILFNKVKNAIMLDLFCGSGQVGIEALSRGAKHVDFVDLQTNTAVANIKMLDLKEKTCVFKKNAHEAVKIIGKKGKKYDIVFIGAPYGYTKIDRLLKEIDVTGILREDGVIILEHRKGLDFNLEFYRIEVDKVYKYGQTVLTFYKEKQDS